MDPMTDKAPEMDAGKMVADADAAGALKPLDDLMAQEGWDLTGQDVILLAQKDDRTRGKKPDELAQMLDEDHSLYEDLLALQPGGALDKAGVGKEKDAKPEGESPKEEKAEEGPKPDPFSTKEEPPADEEPKKKGKPFFGGGKSAPPFGG